MDVEFETAVTRTLSWPDYLVFALVLVISASIGLYYGCTGDKQRTTSEFLMANRQMSAVPVALSLLASFMSAITLLGTPSEIYVYGTQYVWIGIAYIFVVLSSTQIFLPVFYDCNVTTAYEYLGRRFHKCMQVIGAIVFVVQMVIYMGIVLYAPSLALNAVTGFNLWGAVLSVGLVCTFYTTLGGIKAVMWTDVFQICMMFAGLLAVLIRGIVVNGGFSEVWRINYEGGRIEFFNVDMDPTTRHTVWSMAFGGIFTWAGIYAVNQTMVQRAMTVPTYKKVRWAYWVNYPGLTLLMLICSGCGLCVYAVYKDCDPIKSGTIIANDQLLPLFVMDYLNYPGLPGLLTACLFSGALSTVSSGLNSLAAVTLQDLIMVFKKTPMEDATAAKVSKGLAVFYGLFCLLFAYIASKMGQVLQAALGLFGMMSGPMLGIFTLGMMLPFVTWKGAVVGHIVAQICTFWIGFGYYVYGVKAPKLPTRIDGCRTVNMTMNATTTIMPMTTPLLETMAPEIDPQDAIPWIYKISYMWYSFIGFSVAIIVGLTVTLIFYLISKCKDVEGTIFENGFQSVEAVPPIMLSPIGKNVFCCCPMKFKCAIEFGVHHRHDCRRSSCVDRLACEMPHEHRHIDGTDMATDEKEKGERDAEAAKESEI